MLTPRQKQLYDFLCSEAREGRCPSFEEMRWHLDVHPSGGGIERLLEKLVERGFIRRLPNRARAIEVLRYRFIPVSYNALLCRTEVGR